jgi:hypothetical protein
MAGKSPPFFFALKRFPGSAPPESAMRFLSAMPFMRSRISFCSSSEIPESKSMPMPRSPSASPVAIFFASCLT